MNPLNKQAVREEVERISESRLTTVVKKGYDTIVEVKNVAGTVWNTNSAGAAYILGDITSSLFRIATEIFKSSRMIRFVAARVRLIALFSIPFAFVGMCRNGRKMAIGEDRANSGINFAQNLGWFADSTDATIRLMLEFGQQSVTTNQLLSQAIAPLVGISLGSHFISFGWNVYAICKNSRNVTNLDALFLDKASLAKSLNVEEDKVLKAVNNDEVSAKKAFGDRFKAKIVFHSLCVLALAVSAVSLALLAAGTAIMIASNVVISAAMISALGSIIYLGALVYELNSESKLDAYLGAEQNPWKSYAVLAGVISLMSIPVLVAGKIIKTR